METTNEEAAVDTPNEVRLPMLDISPDAAAALFTATEAERTRMVERVFEGEGRTFADVPEAWQGGPLRLWIWLVLTINDIPFSNERALPAVAYGLDFGLADGPVSRWIWVIA